MVEQKNRIKILHILYSGLGGHGNVFFSMVAADIEKKYEFEAIFTGTEPLRLEYKEKCIAANISFSYINKTEGKHVRFFMTVIKSIKKVNPDVLFLHGSILVGAAWLATLGKKNKSKIIVRETQAIHLKSKKEIIALRISMKLADKIVFLSKAYLEEIRIAFGKNYKKNKVVLIPNGIDLKIFSPSHKHEHLDKLVIGMQSRVVAIKDHETLLRSFALIKKHDPTKSYLLKIAGDGDKLKFLMRLADELSIKDDVIFLGMLDEKELPQFLNSLDIYVHASYGETMSTAIMQAMACGKAIVASNVAGIRNMIIDGSTGLLVELKDEKLMADAILSIAKNRSLKQRLESEAYNFAVNEFSNIKMLAKYSKIFNKN